MLKRILSLMTLFLLMLMAAVTLAQDDSPPPEIEVAFDALEARTGETITFATVAAFPWEARDFSDTSLGCPSPGMVYNEVVTPGYQFEITYAGTTYDYRVAEGGDNAVLCDSYPAAPVDPGAGPTPTPPATTDCGAYYEIQPEDILIDIAQECGTTVDAIMDVNPDIEDPSLIYAGQRIALPAVDSPYTVSIAPDSGPPGSIVRITATGLPQGAIVEYGLGRFRSEYDIYGSREVGADGVLSVQETIPEGAGLGEEWTAVVVVNGEESISEVFEVAEANLIDQTQMFLIARGDSGRSGIPVGCDDSLVPVTIDIQPTVAPLRAALTNLFAIETRTYGQSGLYNPLYQSDLTVEGINIENAAATINLSGDVQLGGVCDAPRIQQMLRETALQYNTIDEVSIFVEGIEISEALR